MPVIDSCMYTDERQTIPSFSMLLPDSTTVFRSDDIPTGKKSVLIHFDPTCTDCQEEVEYILAQMQDMNVLIIAVNRS